MSKSLIFPKSLFITGTDTDVGKSVVSAMLVLGLKAAYWKPIQSGADRIDRLWIQKVTGLHDRHFIPEQYLLKQPLSPHAAASIDCTEIEMDKINLPNFDPFPHLIIEGAGGILAPINDHHYIRDIIKRLAIPTLIVSKNRLGTINHTLLTIEQLRLHQIPIFGVVMNGPKNTIHREAIEKFGKVEVIAEIEPLGKITQNTLMKSFINGFV